MTSPSRLLPPVLLAAACTQDSSYSKLHAIIEVAPTSLDFGEVTVSEVASEVIQVFNVGPVNLEISGVTVLDDDSGVFAATPGVATIEPDDSLAIQIDFAPQAFETYERTVVIHSDDSNHPELILPVTGVGTDGPIPDIEVDATELDFGDVAPGETVSDFLTITNTGDGPLLIEGAVQDGSGAFETITWPDGQVLAENGGYFVVIVDYTPATDLGDSGALTITSDDPDEPELVVTLTGNGGGKGLYPVAVIDCPETIEPPAYVTFDGSASYDPSGLEPLTYAWTLVDSPGGSTATLDDAAEAVSGVQVDLAGAWEVALTVTNSAGQDSAPARCAFDAVPVDDVAVELVWDDGDSDLDLHLVREGSALFEMPGDCCWCNETPSWGTDGEDDDPSLILDEQEGYGPELVRIPVPAEDRYYARVHYFEDLGAGTVSATVRFWLDGELADEMTQQLDHNEVWDVGYVRWPEGVVVPEHEDLYAAPTKYCY